ncbi:MAG: superoxide dismutase [Candidatus Pacebacteria bacterium]|nr:superoxide dismutase [Candidatus Paceibacterota bacterium]MBP9851552.1 superoxide dismutase [Candidatus Paceibacterota bacterium]
MKKFEEKKFNIGELKGISAKNIEEHLKLYAGYVTHSNLVLEKINELSVDAEANMPLLSGLQKRFGFEYNGMRNHEVYFSSLSGGASNLSEESELKKMISEEWGSFDKWLGLFKSIATTRGVGWAMLYFDKKENRLLNAWVDEQHLGQLQDCALILALDMWEHSFVYDFQPSGKKQYIEAFFENLNWSAVEENLSLATK